jgi:crotonobetainyl-CoA:carnitine CoA-transferase CaiB-like acyl-CoA transferase
VNRPEDLLADAHVAARHGVVHLDDDGDAILANPLRFGDNGNTRGYTATAPPATAGEHTDAALADVGFSAEEIAALHDEGAV